MGRPVNTEYQKRNAALVRRYTDPTNPAEVHDLANDTGLSRLRIQRILEDAGVTLRPSKRKTLVDNKVRHNNLAAIGARLYAEMNKSGRTMSEMAVWLGLSEPHLGAAMQGLYNWKIYEVIRASERLGLTLEEFFKLPDGMRG